MYYLYIPFTKEEISTGYQKDINEWTAGWKIKNTGKVIDNIYYLDKNPRLSLPLLENAEIFLLITVPIIIDGNYPSTLFGQDMDSVENMASLALNNQYLKFTTFNSCDTPAYIPNIVHRLRNDQLLKTQGITLHVCGYVKESNPNPNMLEKANFFVKYFCHFLKKILPSNHLIPEVDGGKVQIKLHFDHPEAAFKNNKDDAILVCDEEIRRLQQSSNCFFFNSETKISAYKELRKELRENLNDNELTARTIIKTFLRKEAKDKNGVAIKFRSKLALSYDPLKGHEIDSTANAAPDAAITNEEALTMRRGFFKSTSTNVLNDLLEMLPATKI